MRHDWHGPYLFAGIKEVRDTATQWRWTQDHGRLSRALDGITYTQKLDRKMKPKPTA